MGSLSGILQRPLTAAAAVAVASFSVVLPDKIVSPKPSSSYTSQQETKSWLSHISVSKLTDLSFLTRFHIPIPNINYISPTSNLSSTPNSLFNSLASSVASPSALLTPYQSARLANAQFTEFKHSKPLPPSEVMYRWHLPDPNVYKVSENSDCSSAKFKTVVVLLGWLGAKQKHLKKYADWYTSNGFHVITFTFPMSEILSYQVGGKAEQHIDLLVNHLADWLEEEHGKNLVFHTFSNTGWLTYGAILEKFKKQDRSLMGRIRGCVVDSAPVAAPDPRVWASGFSAAFLKKQSIATKGTFSADASGIDVLVGTKTAVEPAPGLSEVALIAVLEKFFEVVLNLPKVNRRLSDVLDLLSSEQPKCPQLYMYSSADRVIPVESVETFIEKQRKAGVEVRACNFVSTPHVDHFRSDPNLYIFELNKFLQDSVLTCCKHSSP